MLLIAFLYYTEILGRGGEGDRFVKSNIRDKGRDERFKGLKVCDNGTGMRFVVRVVRVFGVRFK